MSHGQNGNRDAWAQVSKGDYLHSKYVSEGYAPIQGYAPADVENGYSDHQGSNGNPNGDGQTQDTNANVIEDDDIPEEEIQEFVSSQRQKRNARSQATPKEDQPRSKRAARRAKIASENNGEVSATDLPKGLVEWRDGIFQWWDLLDKQWRTAAYHDAFRQQFIREDSTVGTYVVAPDRGKGASDITSPCSAFNQLAWNLADRESWGNIVDADGNSVMFLLNRPEMQSYEEPERL